MKKYIKLAILVILCMIIVIIGLILINKNNNNHESIETIINDGEKIDFNKFTIVQDLNEYFIIKNIIDRYFANIKELNGDSYINENNLRTSKEEAIEQKKNEAKKYLNNILDEEYKKNYNISDEILNNEAKKYIQNGNYSNSEIVYNVILKDLREGYLGRVTFDEYEDR